MRELAALVVPPVCVGCRGPQSSADAPALCPACMRALRWIGPEGCRRCGLPGHGGRPCPARGAPWASAWSPVVYAGPAKAVVQALKFRGALPLLDLMAAQIATNLPAWSRPPRVVGQAAGAAAAWSVVPVPPDAGRRRRRGFDPADALATRVAARLGLEVARPLVRTGGGRQVGAGRAARRAPDRLDVRALTTATSATNTVLVVDDVHTTGATLRAVAGALAASGVVRIHVVTYARTT